MIDDAFKLTVDKVFPNPKYSFIFNQYIHFFLTIIDNQIKKSPISCLTPLGLTNSKQKLSEIVK